MDTKNLIVVAIVIGVVFFIVIPMIDKYNKQETMANIQDIDKDAGIVKIDEAKCSKQCCQHGNKWPIPEGYIKDDMTQEELAQYVPTNFSCNFGKNNGSGCACIKKDDLAMLTNRGGNA